MSSSSNPAHSDPSHPKFRRAYMACKNCRQRKVKCEQTSENDYTSPCGRCQRKGLECQPSALEDHSSMNPAHFMHNNPTGAYPGVSQQIVGNPGGSQPNSYYPPRGERRDVPSSRRSTVACHTCRRMKIRCITTEQPPVHPCERCERKNLPCEYTAVSSANDHQQSDADGSLAWNNLAPASYGGHMPGPPPPLPYTGPPPAGSRPRYYGQQLPPLGDHAYDQQPQFIDPQYFNQSLNSSGAQYDGFQYDAGSGSGQSYSYPYPHSYQQ